MEGLKYKTNFFVAGTGKFAVVELSDLFSIQNIFTTGRLCQAPHDCHESAFSRTGRSDDADIIPFFDMERHIFEHLSFKTYVVVALADGVHFNEVHGLLPLRFFFDGLFGIPT